MTIADESRALFTGVDWNFDLIKRIDEECGKIAFDEMGSTSIPIRSR